MNKVFRAGAGKNRKSWLIRESLCEKGLNMAKVAAEIGIGRTVVHRTVHGVDNNRKVLAYLVSLGLSPEILSLPPDMNQ